MDGFVIETRDASAARVPSTEPGTALVFTRYGEDKAVVLHPDDFRRLSDLADDLAAATSDAAPPSDLALKAHALEDRPGEPLEDAAAIRSLLDL